MDSRGRVAKSFGELKAHPQPILNTTTLNAKKAGFLLVELTLNPWFPEGFRFTGLAAPTGKPSGK